MKREWWHGLLGYQIYPKSFYDSNGDGIGDLPGVLQKLDYLESLGVGLVWLSPMYPSPMVDNGYDISDYYGVDPRFGTLEDLDRLIAEMKKRGMHLILDLVVNHCSDRHEWFQKAIEDPFGPWGGYFYLKEGKNGCPPNNWRSLFGGSAWEKLPGQENLFYLHTFAKQQPDLNWENPALREEIYRMTNWWLDRGISGFRLDAITNLKKDLTWADLPADGPDGMGSIFRSIDRMIRRDGGTKNGIGVFLSELKERCFAPHDAFTVGEASHVDAGLLPEFIGEKGYFSTIFAFDAINGHIRGACYCEDDPYMDPDQWKQDVFRNQAVLKDFAFEANVVENHDRPRAASLFIPKEEYGFASVTALAGLQVLQRGLPFLYQGQEIGMTNCPFFPEEYDDLSTLDNYRFSLECGYSKEEALEGCARMSRDNCRTPMQWSDGPNAGFTSGSPWLKVNPNYPEINVKKQEQEYGSILNFYRRLVNFYKSEEYGEVLTYGSFEPLYEDQEKIFAFRRRLGEKELTVFCNFSGSERFLSLKEDYSEVIFVNLPQVTRIGNNLILHPFQLIVTEK